MQENRFGLFDAAINTSAQLCKTTIHRNIQNSNNLLAKCDNRYLPNCDGTAIAKVEFSFFSLRDLLEKGTAFSKHLNVVGRRL